MSRRTCTTAATLGTVPHVPLASHYRRRELDAQAERAVARAVAESTAPATGTAGAKAPPHPSGQLDPADARALRGIPCIARGVGGTSPGTAPGG